MDLDLDVWGLSPGILVLELRWSWWEGGSRDMEAARKAVVCRLRHCAVSVVSIDDAD